MIPASLDSVITSLVQAHLESGKHHKNALPEVYRALRLSLTMLPVRLFFFFFSHLKKTIFFQYLTLFLLFLSCQLAEYELLQYLTRFWSQVVRATKLLGVERKQGRNWMAVAVTPQLTHISVEGGRDGNTLDATIYMELILDNIDIVWSPTEDFRGSQASRMSASFLKQLEVKDSAFMRPMQARMTTITDEGLFSPLPQETLESLGARDTQTSSENDEDAVPFDKLSMLFPDGVEYPIIRLVPMNSQFAQTEIQLYPTLKLCRVLKKGNLKKGLEQHQTFAFDSKCVSREHAEIAWLPDSRQVTVKDLRSTCGTRVNGKKLPTEVAFVVRHGDNITLGENIPEGEDDNRAYEDDEG